MNAQTSIGQPNVVAMVFFFIIIAITLGITYWAARRTRTTEHFYAAGRTVSPAQNGLALAGDHLIRRGVRPISCTTIAGLK